MVKGVEKQAGIDFSELSRNFFFVGDSHTVGMLGQTRENVFAQGGISTKAMLDGVDGTKVNGRPLVLLWGTNDIVNMNMSVDQIVSNLSGIIQKSSAKKVYLWTIPPIGDPYFREHKSLNREKIQGRIEELNARIASLQIPGVAITTVPVYDRLLPQWQRLSTDGIHNGGAIRGVFAEYLSGNKENNALPQVSEAEIQKAAQLSSADLRREIDSQAVTEERRVECKRLLAIVKRRENREARLSTLKAKHEKLKDKKADDIKASELLALETEEEWLLSKTFLYTLDQKTQEYVSYDRNTVKEGNEMLVDFWQNASANRSLGLGDMLPPKVRVVVIKDKTGNERLGVRRSDRGRVGYYDGESYLPIYNGYMVRIPEKQEIEKFLQKSDKKFAFDSYYPWNGSLSEPSASEIEAETKTNKDFYDRLALREQEINLGKWARKWIFPFYGTQKELGPTVKTLSDLDGDETRRLLVATFWSGPATDLLLSLDKSEKKFAVKRMIALANHEWGFGFGRRNPDPASGFDIGTFQIWWAGTTEEDSLKKYTDCLKKWAIISGKVSASELETMEVAQRDLLAHIGYIDMRPGGVNWIFADLSNPDLDRSQTVELMSRRIQWGISAIWHSVFDQLQNYRIDLSVV